MDGMRVIWQSHGFTDMRGLVGSNPVQSAHRGPRKRDKGTWLRTSCTQVVKGFELVGSDLPGLADTSECLPTRGARRREALRRPAGTYLHQYSGSARQGETLFRSTAIPLNAFDTLREKQESEPRSQRTQPHQRQGRGSESSSTGDAVDCSPAEMCFGLERESACNEQAGTAD